MHAKHWITGGVACLTLLFAVLFGVLWRSVPQNTQRGVNDAVDPATGSSSASSPSQPVQRQGRTAGFEVHFQLATSSTHSGTAQLLAANNRGGIIDRTVTVPGSTWIEGAEDWIFVVLGSGLVPHLGAISSDSAVEQVLSVSLIPCGTVRYSIVPGWNDDADANVQAILGVPPNLIADIQESVRGVPLCSNLWVTATDYPQLERLAIQASDPTLEHPGPFAEILDALTLAIKSTDLILKLQARPSPLPPILSTSITADGKGEIACVPAGAEYRWKLMAPFGALVEPFGNKSHVSPSGEGFVMDFEEKPGSELWSSRFTVSAGEVATLTARTFRDNLITGILDYSKFTQELARARVALYHVTDEVDTSGSTFRNNQSEAFTLVAEDGKFSLSGVRPGKKRLAMTWQDKGGNYFMANRSLQIGPDDWIDLGLVSADPGPVVSIHLGFVTEHDVAVSWHELFEASSTPGLVTLIINSAEKRTSASEDIWDAIYARIGDHVSLHGLASGKWRCTPVPGGLDEVWPEPKVKLTMEGGIQEIYFDNYDSATVDVSFRMDLASQVLVKLQPPVTNRLGPVEGFTVWIYDFQSEQARNQTVRFERTGEQYEAELSLPAGRSYLVVQYHDLKGILFASAEVNGTVDENPAHRVLALVEGVDATGVLGSSLLARNRSGVVGFDLVGWPSMKRTPLVASLSPEGEFSLRCVPKGADLYERKLGFVVNTGLGQIGTID